MTIAERIHRYEERGFNHETASVNVLLEEAVAGLFEKFPNTLVFFGGASLVLFYGSTRHSGDLDLLVAGGATPDFAELQAVLTEALEEPAALLGFNNISVQQLVSGEDFVKIAVLSNEQTLFSVDLTKISAVIKNEIIEVSIDAEPIVSKIKIPSRDLHLLYKVEAFLKRRFLRVRDAFDIKLLLDSGATLSETLKAHLSDGPASEHLEDPDFIRTRIAGIDVKACTAELKNYLPPNQFAELLDRSFEPLRAAVTEVLEPWLN